MSEVPHNDKVSFWIGTTPETAYPALDDRLSVDVAVVGGGITGLTAALLLKESGRSVAVIEARRVALGTTGNTTAKITSLHGLVYDTLIAKHGEDRARLYGEANQAAVETIAGIVNRHAIDCDFLRMAAYTYTESRENVGQIEAEVEAARRLGLPASFVHETSLPFPVSAAVRFDNQALFHPRRYCVALAALVDGAGSHVFEMTRATGIEERDGTVEVVTERGIVEARHVIIATLLPFHDPIGLFAKTHPSRSYAVSAEVDGVAPDGMFLSVDSPTRSVRPHPTDGPNVLIIGGEEHKTGQETDTEARYAAVEAWARERFAVRSIDHRWSAQDYVPADGIPYVGRMKAGSDTLLVAAGFKKWGMSNGTAAAMMLTDIILGRANPWLSVFDARRLEIGASVESLVKENLNVASRFIGDRFRRAGPGSPGELRPGEGAVVDHHGEKVAAYRAVDGSVTAVSARCTHMGCLVDFNPAERTWDCPCHGSRFATDGLVIEGPATSPLAPKDVGVA